VLLYGNFYPIGLRRETINQNRGWVRIQRAELATLVPELVEELEHLDRISGGLNHCVYDDLRSIKQALAHLENQGWVRGERAAGLNNVHFASYRLRERYQQHPVKLVRAYRKNTPKGAL